MTTVVAGIVQNALFGSRNCLLGANVLAPDQNNQVRLLVSAGQTANLIQGARHCGNSVFEKISDKLVNVGEKVAQNDKFLGKLAKVVDFARKNINNLIVVSSGIKVLTSDDKKSEFIAQTGNIAGMFAVEGWMKKNLAKYINKLPINNKLKPILEGIVFVIGSISGSTICYNIGRKIAAKMKEGSGEKPQAKEIQQPADKSIDIKS